MYLANEKLRAAVYEELKEMNHQTLSPMPKPTGLDGNGLQHDNFKQELHIQVSTQARENSNYYVLTMTSSNNSYTSTKFFRNESSLRIPM